MIERTRLAHLVQSRRRLEVPCPGRNRMRKTKKRSPRQPLPLPFDMVRRFSQPMGIDLERWIGRIIAQEKGVVRLLPVVERAKSLFGIEGSATTANWIDAGPDTGAQLTLFPISTRLRRPHRYAGKAATVTVTVRIRFCNRLTPRRLTVCTPPCCFRRAVVQTPCKR